MSDTRKTLKDYFQKIGSNSSNKINYNLDNEVGEEISLNNENLTGYFPPEENSYFQSVTFGKVLEYFKKNHKNCEMKELKGKLIFRIKNVKSIQEAIEKTNSILMA